MLLQVWRYCPRHECPGADPIANIVLPPIDQSRELGDGLICGGIDPLQIRWLPLADRMGRALMPQAVQVLDRDPVILPSPPPLGTGQIEDQSSVPRDARRPVTDALSSHDDRQLDVELQLHHFERRCVLMPHQVTDEPAVLADTL